MCDNFPFFETKFELRADETELRSPYRGIAFYFDVMR